MGAAVVILLVAGFTVYTLVNPAVGVVIWVAALAVGGAAVVGRVTRRRSSKS